MISLEKLKILTPLQKLSPKTLKSCPKSNKSPNLVTLDRRNIAIGSVAIKNLVIF